MLLWRINSIRNFLTTDAVKTLVCSMVLHVLTIAIHYSQVYLSVSLRRYNMCKMLQQRWFFRHQNLIMSHPFFKSFTGYPLAAEIEHKMFTLCYNSLSGTAPQYLSDLILVYTSSRCLCSSSDSLIIRIPTVKTKSYGQCFFAYQSPTI